LLGMVKSGRGASSTTASPSAVAARKLLAGIPVLLVTLTIPLTGCGESKQEQAAKSVCSARSDIKSRIATLQTLTPSIATLPQVKTEVTAIADDLKQIQGAQGDLQPARKQQVQQATQTFEQQLKAVLSDLTTNFSISGAGTKLESALKQLASSYSQALQPIECS
jgi:predicted flap endonuclease-1-like 5' DNA nuclease